MKKIIIKTTIAQYYARSKLIYNFLVLNSRDINPFIYMAIHEQLLPTIGNALFFTIVSATNISNAIEFLDLTTSRMRFLLFEAFSSQLHFTDSSTHKKFLDKIVITYNKKNN